MSRIELEITGNATGLENASKKAAGAVSGLTKSTSLSKAQIEAWDAAARRNQMEQYGNDAKRATNNVNNLSQAQRKLTGTTQGLTTGIRGANTVGIEFSRIIQDAPYGIIGVGNNITQLTQNFAHLRAQTNSTGQALSIAFKSMFSGANLLVLGVSAVTTAFTLYSMWARKNKKETEELDDAVRSYIDSLSDLERAELDAQKANDKALTTLDSLWAIYNNVNSSQQDRLSAMRQIISENPAYFKGLKDEELLTNKAAEAYGSLRNSLILAATARAYGSRLESATSQFIDEDEYIKRLEKRAEAVARRISETTMRTLGLIASGEVTGQAITSIPADELRAHDELLKIQDEIRTRSVERFKYSQQQIQLEKKITDITRQRLQYFDLESETKNETAKATRDQVNLEETLSKLRQESIQVGLSGYEKELQASQHKYDELKRQADEHYRQGKASAKEYADYIARLQGFRVGEAGRIIQGAGSMSVPLGQGSPSTQGVVSTQLPNQVAKVVASDPVWDAFVDDLDKQLSRAVHSFGRDFMRTLTTINQQAGVTFGGVVSGIIGSLTGGITEVMSTVFSKELGDAVKGAFGSDGLGKPGTYWAAGGALLGSIVSGSANRTSVGGQALGGVLSGAGTGAAIGSVVPGIGTAVGAVVGGLVGAIGGLFGASSAKKQQEEILAEERKQTALLERANALSYASSIIGQMTAGGAVTGIMRDAFGQLVATVKGSDLQFVLQRVEGQR